MSKEKYIDKLKQIFISFVDFGKQYDVEWEILNITNWYEMCAEHTIEHLQVREEFIENLLKITAPHPEYEFYRSIRLLFLNIVYEFLPLKHRKYDCPF